MATEKAIPDVVSVPSGLFIVEESRPILGN
jgi:hypothetical protein